MDKFEKVIEGLKHCTSGEGCFTCPYYPKNDKDICTMFNEAIELIGLKKEINQMNITTEQAVKHLKQVGWLKMYEEFIMMKKRLGLIDKNEEYQYENWH